MSETAAVAVKVLLYKRSTTVKKIDWWGLNILKQLPRPYNIFLTCQDLLAEHEWTVVSERQWHTEYQSLLEKITGPRLIINCVGCVHPYQHAYEESLHKLIELVDSDSDLQVFYFSVNHYPELAACSRINYHWFPEYHAVYWPLWTEFLIDTQRPLTKKFLCLNKRFSPARWFLYCKFYTDNLLDKSFFSFLGEYKCDGNLQSDQALEQIECLRTNKGPRPFGRLAYLENLQKPDVPFISLSQDLLLEHYQQQGTGGGFGDSTWLADHDLYQQSFCSVISETSFDANLPNFSEKTFRALSHGHPVIMIGSPRSVATLRDWGFDMFDDLIDHSYDLEPDEGKRLVMAMQQIDRINGYDLSQLQKLRSDLLPRLIHNRNTYQSLYHRMLARSRQLNELLRKHMGWS